MKRTMRAMILKKAMPIERDPLELAELPVPEPGPGEILLRVRMCGLCHTDLHTVEGDLPLPVLPLVPGHQIVGIVEKAGPGGPGLSGEATPLRASHGAPDLRIGSRVGAAWLYSSCGTCRFCERGLENLCENARFTGYHRHGGYAEYVVLPASFVYALPEGFSVPENGGFAPNRHVARPQPLDRSGPHPLGDMGRQVCNMRQTTDL